MLNTVMVETSKKVDLEKIFRTFRFKKSAQQIKDEMKEGWYQRPKDGS